MTHRFRQRLRESAGHLYRQRDLTRGQARPFPRSLLRWLAADPRTTQLQIGISAVKWKRPPTTYQGGVKGLREPTGDHAKLYPLRMKQWKEEQGGRPRDIQLLGLRLLKNNQINDVRIWASSKRPSLENFRGASIIRGIAARIASRHSA